MELGRPNKQFGDFMRRVATIADQQFNAELDGREPRIYRAQFSYKWRCRIALAYRKTQALMSLQLHQKIIKRLSRANRLPQSFGEVYL